MAQNILSKITSVCPFPEVFEEKEMIEGSVFPVYCKKVGHLRADYDGWRWWNTLWPCHPEMLTQEIAEEIDNTYDALISEDALKDLTALRAYCAKHEDACIAKETGDEYDFFLVGEYCNFWIRLITRKGDYNLYLHAFTKQRPQREYFAYLEALRQSGETNMYGAVPYLQEEFPELRYDRNKAKEILLAWIKTFSDKGGAEE